LPPSDLIPEQGDYYIDQPAGAPALPAANFSAGGHHAAATTDDDDVILKA
jgi:hypothetical protein